MERKTLLSRETQAPSPQGVRVSIPNGAFGDYSGVQNLSQGLEQAGNAGFSYVNKLAEVQKQKQLRDEADAKDTVQALAYQYASQGHQDYTTRVAQTDGTDALAIAASSFKDQQDQYQSALADSAKKNPGILALSPDYAKRVWAAHTMGSIDQANTHEVTSKVDLRQQTHDQATFGALNTVYGNDPIAATDYALKDSNDVFNAADKYTRDYRFAYKARIGGQLLNNFQGLAIEQAKAGELQPDLIWSMDRAESDGLISKEQKNRVLAIKIHADTFNRANATERLSQDTSNLTRGFHATPLELHQMAIRAVKDPVAEPDKVNENIRTLTAASALGVINGRLNHGELPFPFTGKSSTLYQVQTMLKGASNDTQARQLLQNLAEQSGQDATKLNYTPDEIKSFVAPVLKAVTDSTEKIDTGHANEIAQFSPLVNDALQRTKDSDIRTQIGETLKAYQAWYDANGIPPEKQVLMHQPHIDHLKELYAQHDQNKFLEYGQALTDAYGAVSPVALNRALSKDPDAKEYAPLVRLMSQSAQTTKPTARKSIGIFRDSMASALFNPDITKIKTENPDAETAAKAYLNLNGPKFDIAGAISSPSFSDTIGAQMVKMSSSEYTGDQTAANILDVMKQNEGTIGPAMHDALVKTILYNAYGKPGASRDVAKEAALAVNGLNSAFMVVRTGGTYNDSGMILEIPSSTHRDRFTNAIMGEAAGEARYTDEESKQTSAALDAIMLQGLDQAKYSGFLSWMAKADDMFGSTIAGHMGYRINGYENRSVSMFHPNDPRPDAQVPDALKIDWANVVLKDSSGGTTKYISPGQSHDFLNDSSVATAYADRFRRAIGTTLDTDPATANHQVLSRYGFFRQVPNGDYALYVRPASVRNENNAPGPGGDAVAAYTYKNGVEKPVIISRRAMIAFRDMMLDLRVDSTTAAPGLIP